MLYLDLHTLQDQVLTQQADTNYIDLHTFYKEIMKKL